ncbi:MAG: DNA polymerase I [Lachnospiraceae bacterium]|nr:DNA polymerase I [Ruminococcus sp.]MCM1275961.1 DNA polymerase I [Lachnospiraceae bacterium]
MKLLLIDGNSIMNRAFYGIRLLTNKKGVPTNALTGFLNIYFKLIKEESPDRIAAAFDLKAPTFRHKMYDGYKATRHGMPDELAAQMPIIKDILRSLGIAVLEVEGYEADDVIGTLSRAAAEQGADCVISTGDRDSFQLVGDRVTVRLAANKEDIYYTPEKINELYGVTPREMLEVKALMGDSSDNIPGVAGIGEKTALSLIQKYHSVQFIFDNLAEIEVTKSVRAKLESGKESAELSRKLGEICLTAPVPEDMDEYVFGEGDKSAAVGILQELEMNSAIKKLNLVGVAAKEVKLPTAEKIAENRAAKPSVTPDGSKYDDGAPNVLLINGEIAVFQGAKRLDGELKALLESDAPKHTDNAKALFAKCISAGIDLKNVTFDATLAAYLLNVNSSDYDIERLCGEYKTEIFPEEPQKSLELLNRALFDEICAQGMLKVLREIEIPLAEVLASMEHEGIALDVDALHKFGKEIQPKIVEIEQNIHELAGRKFNVGSPKQLSVVLFEELGLPAGKKRKTGYSTDSETLEALIDKHPIIAPILEYRKLTKLYNTYVKGLENAVSEDGRMYTTFKQTETRTGRISSAEPNIQNIPVRTEIGRNFRKFFTATRGKVLCDADYSQIELRVLAALANDKVMIETFKEGRDIHTETAASVFRRAPEEVDADLRRKAKAVNFGIVYGIGAFSLAKDVGTSVGMAKLYIDDYLAHFSGVRQYMETNTKSAEVDGYAVTMFGRRRFIPEILSTNKNVKALGKRIAMNTPIQGTAADIIKIAMVRVYNRLKRELPEAKLILQVHDELIVEAPEAVSQKALEILREEMQNAVELAVPLPVDAKIGRTWYDVH